MPIGQSVNLFVHFPIFYGTLRKHEKEKKKLKRRKQS